MARPGQLQQRLATGTPRISAVLTMTLCLVGTLTALPAPAAAAAAPESTEIMLPAAPRAVPRATQILNAGTTGFLWAQEGDDRLLWTDYATGTPTALTHRLPGPVTYDIDSGYFSTAASFQPGWYGAGSDTLALYSAEPSPHVTLLRGGSGENELPLPEGQSYQGTFGEFVLTRADGQAFHLLRAGTDTPVTGFPAGTTEVTVEDGDARSVILRYKTADQSDGWGHWGIVELATGAFTPLPDRPDPDAGWEVSAFRLGRDSVLRLRSGRTKLDVLDRADLSAEPRIVETGSFSHQAEFGIVGSALLAVDPIWTGNNIYRGQPLWAVRTDSPGRATKVMDPAAHQIVEAPDGSVLVAGADRYVEQGDLDWGIYRITQAADGSVERRRLTAVQPMPAQIHGLALGSGILSTADNSTAYAPSSTLGAYRSTWLTTPVAGEALAVERATVDGRVSGRDGFCHSDSPRCIRMFADGTGHHGRAEPTESGLTMLYVNGASSWGPTLDTGDGSPRLADLSGRYAVVDGAVYPGRQHISEFRYGGSGAVLQRRDRVAAAVWGSTLWSGAASGGVVTATRLPTGDVVETFTTSNDCTLSDLQAVGRWVYWACVDYWGWVRGSGVYDRTSKRTAAAPAGQVLLGDGYLVEQVAGTGGGLRLVDLRGELPSRMLVGTDDLGREGGARTSWTVDRFGGGVAYADEQQRVHIVPTGIPASALNVIDSTVVDTAANWSGAWWLSKPAAAWQVTFRNSSGATIRTLSGSSARGLLRAAWDGRDTAGQAVADGTFTWTLTAQPADGVGAALTVAGPPIQAPPAPAPLRATRAPAILGALAVGSTVQAVPGTWTPAPTSYEYQWLANGTAIRGATRASLPISASLLGKRLAVRVTAKRAGSPSGTASSAASAAVAKGKAPKATKRPSITGTVKVGRTVRAAVGTWSPKADSYRYEWRLNGKVIRGATRSTLKLTSSMRNKKLTVTVIARKAGHLDGRATSTAVTVRR
ncbi:FlgD immunoglobulin-like domain containing protein [Micromonospora sp. NPDC093277]|uniref:FlgD immunoglobulin-like domain containing protein n=1 Tax=Micromonospora sp. NPDC093277 TaxID=3364291 RepID=UPI003805A094